INDEITTLNSQGINDEQPRQNNDTQFLKALTTSNQDANNDTNKAQ
ncbi:2143_t:CDS:1, partial [Gigaspora rosea]